MKTLSRGWSLVVMLLAALAPGVARSNEIQAVRVRALDPGIALERAYFLPGSASDDDAVAWRDGLIDAGARNVNLFLPDRLIVCDMPTGVAVDVPAAFARVSSFQLEGAQSSLASASWGWIVDAYRHIDEAAGNASLGPATSGGAPFNDVVIPVSTERAREVQRTLEAARSFQGLAPLAQPARSMQHNSEFLGGSVLANFVFPESDGSLEANTETWTDADLVTAKQGVAEALLAWQGLFPKMDLSFTIVTHDRVATSYEPIQHSMRDDGLWVVEVLRSLGVSIPTNDMMVAAHQFNENQRAIYRAQWVFSAFIASSRNVENHRFGGGSADYTAYAFLGGPCLIEPYPAGTDPNGVGERLVYSQIVNHEAGHCFWTLDEYPGAPGGCGDASGYLNYSNGNLTQLSPGGELQCNVLQDCIMHSAARDNIFPRPWCRWSQGHLGVIDNNNIPVPDIFESPPRIEFAVEGPETVTTNNYTLRFRAISTAVPNRNSRIDPEDRIDYAPPLRRGWVSFSQESRILIKPLDNKWGGVVEEFEYPMPVAAAGANHFFADVENSAGVPAGRATKTVYFVGVNYTRTGVTVSPSRMDVSWEIVADPFGAKFNVYRLDRGEALPGRLVGPEVAPAGPPSNGFVPYRYTDRTVKAGTDYRYYVEGVFDLPSEGGVKTYRSKSNIIEQTAMIPVPEGNILSNIAPNPSRGAVTMSLQVPRTYTGPEVPVREPTPVEVSIYSVTGQLVRTLHKSASLSDVVTLHWDGTNQSNAPAPSGIYFVRAVAGSSKGVQKIVLIR